MLLWYRQSTKRSDKAIRSRIVEIANTRIRSGVNRLHALISRECWKDNKKRLHRIYKEEGLNLLSKRPRRSKVAANRMERAKQVNFHRCWSMDSCLPAGTLLLTICSMAGNLGS